MCHADEYTGILHFSEVMVFYVSDCIFFGAGLVSDHLLSMSDSFFKKMCLYGHFYGVAIWQHWSSRVWKTNHDRTQSARELRGHKTDTAWYLIGNKGKKIQNHSLLDCWRWYEVTSVCQIAVALHINNTIFWLCTDSFHFNLIFWSR